MLTDDDDNSKIRDYFAGLPNQEGKWLTPAEVVAVIDEHQQGKVAPVQQTSEILPCPHFYHGKLCLGDDGKAVLGRCETLREFGDCRMKSRKQESNSDPAHLLHTLNQFSEALYTWASNYPGPFEEKRISPFQICEKINEIKREIAASFPENPSKCRCARDNPFDVIKDYCIDPTGKEWGGYCIGADRCSRYKAPKGNPP